MSGLLPDQSAAVMSYLLIIFALLISATRTLTLMVRFYQGQALVLTSVVLITAFQHSRTLVALGLLAILPLTLAGLAPRLLARATLYTTAAGTSAHEITGLARHVIAQPRALTKARRIWLRHGASRLPVSLSAAIDMFLIATAILAAYRLSAGTTAPSLATSLALVLQGLFTMINKNDIVSQIIGLLVVDHGLFLAAVRVAPPALAGLFVVSLYLYVLVTLVILGWILPGLRRTSSSIEVSGNAELRG